MDRQTLVRGVIEGFYGHPWTEGERLRMIQFMAQQGFNQYLYLPKHDPFLRDEWRRRFPEDVIGQYRAWVQQAEAVGVELAFGIAPGLDMHYADPAEIECLLDKVRTWVDLGVRSFALLFDDINPALSLEDQAHFVGPGQAQADIANRLFRCLKDARSDSRLVFCPTEYWGYDDTPYKVQVAREMERDIAVFWTGPEICSPTITADAVRKVRDLYRHPVVIWDNYPVNDMEMSDELHLGPLEGRTPDLLQEIVGYYANPMDRAESSKVALFTTGQFLLKPEEYQPADSWQTALEQWGPQYQAVLKTIGWATREACVGSGSALSQALSDAWEASARTAPHVPPEMAEVAQWQNLSLGDVPAPLREEVRPWVEKMVRIGTVAAWCQSAEPDMRTGRRLLTEAEASSKKVLGGIVEKWARGVLGDGRTD